METLSDLVIFQGETTTATGRLYARWPLPNDGAEYELTGKVIGPDCHYATTLPATIGMLSRATSGVLLAETVVPDPCTWTIDLPSLYRVVVELACDGQVIDVVERQFGFRRLGVVGPFFSFEGRRWLLRGGAAELGEVDWPAWRSLRLVRLCDSPTELDCRTASEQGVMLAAMVPSELPTGVSIQQELQRLAGWPAVVAAIVKGWPAGGIDRQVAPNLMVGTYCSDTDSPSALPAADFCCVPESQTMPEDCDRAVVAFREDKSLVGQPTELRKECDFLQRDLAPRDLAGYCIGCLE